MLVAYDIPNQKLSVMNIPRDTLVNVSWDIKKINSVYNMYGGGDEGMDALKEEVSQLVGFIPDYTFVVEWAAVGKLVDAVGGVYFDVPRRMYYNDLSQNFKIDLQEGYQLIDGDKAMQLLRWRHNSDDSGHILNSGYANGDLGRIETQQEFLKAAIEQCLQKITDVKTITGIAQIFFENVTTELSVGNLAWFAQQAVFGNSGGQKLDMSSVTFLTMPWVSADGVVEPDLQQPPPPMWRPTWTSWWIRSTSTSIPTWTTCGRTSWTSCMSTRTALWLHRRRAGGHQVQQLGEG